MPKYDVVIVGAGIAGLSAAIQLQNEGLHVKILEAADAPGGRIRTDHIDGFLLDRGFQVLLTAYPELRQPPVNLNELQLHPFLPGAMVFHDDYMYRLNDPFRQPLQSFATLFSKLATWNDKLKIIALRNRHKRLSLADLFEQPEQSTEKYLNEWNFSPLFRQAFLRPFISSILLDPELSTSSRMFEFVFKMFAEGYAALPKDGMEALPRQLAANLQPNTIQLNTAVVKIEKNKLKTATGETFDADAIIVATNAQQAQALLGSECVSNTQARSLKCIYFSSDKPPIDDPLLMLNGETDGLISHVCVPSLVNPNYAPVGRHLISVNIIKNTADLDEEILQATVKKELRRWFRKEVRYWEHLKTYTIDYALPLKTSIQLPNKQRIQPIKHAIFMCGDHTHSASINGAIESGRYTAAAVSWHLALHNRK